MIVEALESKLEAFERDNPALVRELDILGVEIEEYELAIAESSPRVVTGNSSVTLHDVE